MVAICAALLAIITPILVTQAVSTLSTTSQSVLFEDALAAAQAGVQQYRNYLDLESNYFQCNYKSDCGNHALDVADARCPDASAPTCGWYTIDVPAGSPAEAFHYFPDPCFLTGDSCGGGEATAAVLLTVTGRAGNPGHYVFRTIQVSMQSTGLLSNAYFSDYEVEDALQNTTIVYVSTYSEVAARTTAGSTTVTGSFTGVQVGDTVNAEKPFLVNGVFSPSGSCQAAIPSACVTVKSLGSGSPPTSITLSSAANSTGNTTLEIGTVTKDTMQSAPAVPTGPTTSVPLWQELCQYHTYEANNFVNSLYGTSNQQTGQPASYFGPWRGPSPTGAGSSTDPFDYIYGTLADGSPAETAGVIAACGSPYNFQSSENFNGPVATEDQLWVCGNPNFEFGLKSRISPTTESPGYSSWPTYSGGGTWIDNTRLDWDGSCGLGGPSNPSFGIAPITGQDLSLPTVNGALATSAKNGGCYFTGPTIIEFLHGGTMDVWSPLSGVAGASPVGSPSTCGTWPSAGVQNVAIPSAGGLVIYVGNVPGTVSQASIAAALATGEAIGALPATANCPDPWLPFLSSCPTLPNGDAVVEGELQGQVTLGTAGSIVVSRDISYQCADDSSSVTSQQDVNYSFPTSGATNCTTGEPDILGLVAQNDVVVSHPGATSSTNDNQIPRQTEPGEWPASGWCPISQDGTEITPTTPAATALAEGVPDCRVSNPVVDAAVLAVSGSFADEDWDMTDNGGSPTGYSQGVYLHGTDISNYRGPFGCGDVPVYCPGQSTGFSKDFSYDHRLAFLTPPDLLKIASLLWDATGFVNCGTVNDNSTAFESYSSNFCPGLLRLGG
jgi:hypothetical protein